MSKRKVRYLGIDGNTSFWGSLYKHCIVLLFIRKPLSWQFTPPEVAMTSRTFIKQMRINQKTDLQLQLHAQSEQLNLIIVVEMCVYVKEQRRDAYYRNDPKKYGLGL